MEKCLCLRFAFMSSSWCARCQHCEISVDMVRFAKTKWFVCFDMVHISIYIHMICCCCHCTLYHIKHVNTITLYVIEYPYVCKVNRFEIVFTNEHKLYDIVLIWFTRACAGDIGYPKGGVLEGGTIPRAGCWRHKISQGRSAGDIGYPKGGVLET